MEWNHFNNFGRGSPKEHFCEFFFEIGPLALGEMSLKSFSIFSFGSHFVQWSRTTFTILVEGQPRNSSVELF